MLSVSDVWISGPETCTGSGSSFVGSGNSFSLHGLARVPGQTRIWAAGLVSHPASSSTWDSLIAQYPAGA